MIRSMTGYCSVREQIGEAAVTLEIKALNHKGYDVHYHSPRALAMMEVPLRERLQKSLCRGRIEVFLRASGALFSTTAIEANVDAARSYCQAAETIAKALNLEFRPSLEMFFRLDGVFEAIEPERSESEDWKLIENLVERAICELLEMKSSEGERMKIELESILQRIEQWNREIQEHRKTVMDEFREKMLARIAEWNQSLPLDLDPGRVLQEVAFYTDRSDIQEETARLQSHIDQFKDLLREGRADQPYKAVGRRLDFLCQEMFRESNTIGSKSTSMEIIRPTLEIKSAIEQLREQVQNIE